ncbi:hypothetical protein K438DRAFT_1977578 [Mycena galopus ATCC 62051]|nr:hypothetical protein K438DRAFT_1977578 [Mycena galopus ATCC 62051]
MKPEDIVALRWCGEPLCDRYKDVLSRAGKTCVRYRPLFLRRLRFHSLPTALPGTRWAAAKHRRASEPESHPQPRVQSSHALRIAEPHTARFSAFAPSHAYSSEFATLAAEEVQDEAARPPRPSAPTAYERVDKTAASRSRLSNRILAVSHTHWCLLSRASRPTVPPPALQRQVRRPDDKPHPTAYNSRALRTTRCRSQQPASPSQCFRALTASSELALAPQARHESTSSGVQGPVGVNPGICKGGNAACARGEGRRTDPASHRSAAGNKQIYFTAITVAHLVRTSAPPPTLPGSADDGHDGGVVVASTKLNPRVDSHARTAVPSHSTPLMRSTAHIPNACPVPASPTPRRIAAINEEIYFTAITVAHLVRLSAPPPTPWQRRRRGRGRGGGVASREQNPRDDSHAHQCLPIPPPTSPTPTTRHKSVVMTANAIPAAHLRAPLAPAPMIRVQVYAVHILLIQFLATGESALGSRTSTPPPLLPAPMCRTAADQTIDHDPLLVG